MRHLFSQKGEFRVARLSEADARADSDHLQKLRELVLENEPMYPHIDKWFEQKVVPGLKTAERVGYVGYLDERPAVSAIVKRSKAAKFCHLRIKEELQDFHLGETFFALMGLEVRPFAKEVHFTLPEGLWEKEKKFFESFGFTRPVKAGHQYRIFEDELRCSSTYETVWGAVLKKLPKIGRAFAVDGNSLDSNLLMSIRAEHARKVLSGKKKVEIRRRFSMKWAGCTVSIYASGTERCIVGAAYISQVVAGEPGSIWERFHEDLGCTKREFDEYTRSASEIYAVVLENARPYRRSVSLADVSRLTQKKLRPPQSYCDLTNNVNWAEAVSMSALLQSSFSAQEMLLL